MLPKILLEATHLAGWCAMQVASITHIKELMSDIASMWTTYILNIGRKCHK
jgi:hypothetical protein